MSCTVVRLACFRLGMFSPGLSQDRQNAVTAQAMTNQTHGPGTVRELPKSLSGIYRNACPGITEFRVRELAKRAIDWAELRGVVEYVDGELDDGTTAPLLPHLKLRAELELMRASLGPAEDAYLVFGLDYADSQAAKNLVEPFIQFDTPPPPFGTASTDSYTLIDVTAGARFGAIDVSLGVENLLDDPYRDLLDTYKIITLSPGRNVMLTPSTDF